MMEFRQGGINPGAVFGSSPNEVTFGSSPNQLTNVNGLLYFAADNSSPNSNRELWKVVTDAAPPVIPPTPVPPLSSLAPVVDAGGSIQVFAGDQLSRVISFRDEDSSAFTITVNYGEGGGAETLDYRRDNRTMQLDHVFQKAGTYTVTVSVRDDSLPTSRLGTDSFQVTVLNTPPEVAFNEVLLTKRIREGETVNLSGTFEDLGQRDNHTIEVNWGDGTPIVPQAIAVARERLR